MQCSKCRESMAILEFAETEVDHCFSCQSIWLDEGELAQLLGDTFQAKEFLNSFIEESPAPEKFWKCPICRLRMKKVSVGTGEEKVFLDRCPRTHGIWFDRGELAGILRVFAKNAPAQVTEILSAIFK